MIQKTPDQAPPGFSAMFQRSAPTGIRALAVLSGGNAGKILTDDPLYPHWGLIWEDGHLVTRWVNGARFSPFRRVEAYVQTGHHYSVPFPADFEQFIETMRTIEAEQQRDPSDWRHFCHNDLVSVNYLYCDSGPADQDRSIKIFDWEFAGLGEIYYDLASLVYTHDSEGPISPDLEEVMLWCYFSQVTQQQMRRINGMKYMLMLFTGMWRLAQHGMQTAALIPPVEGFDYLEFAQYLFAHEIHDLQRICAD